MNCISCQFPLPAVAKFCLECGTKQPFYCQCGQELPSTAKFCMECGTAVRELSSQADTVPVAEETITAEPQGQALNQEADWGQTTGENQAFTQDVAEPVADIAPEPVADIAPEPVADIAPEPVADIAPEPVADIVPEPVADIAPEPVVDIAPEPVVDIAPEPVVDIAPEPVADIAPEPITQVEAEPYAEEIPAYEEDDTSNKPLLMEFYGLTLRTECNLYLRRFRESLYYYDHEKQAICVSKEDGSDERMIIPCMGKPSGMFVNQTGIYLYYFQHLEVGIPRYTLDGLHIATMDVPSHAQMKDVYVHEDTAYVAVSELMDFELGKDYSHCRSDVLGMARDKRKDLIYYLNYGDQTQKAFHFYGEQGDFRLICANESDIVFMASFTGDIEGVLEKNEGYYRYNKANNTIASLSHRACQPHWLASDKDRYQKTCQENQKSAEGFRIPFFDMEHKMMWVEQSDEKGNYLEARSIDSPGKSELRTDMPKWYYKMPHDALHRVYFDGCRMYHLQDDDSLVSILLDGSEVVLTAQDHCQKFVMAEEFIYIYSQNYDLHQHKAQGHGLPLVRNLALQFP